MSSRKRHSRCHLFSAIVLELVLMAALVVMLQPNVVGNPQSGSRSPVHGSRSAGGVAENISSATPLLADVWHVATAGQSPRPLNRHTASIPCETHVMEPPSVSWGAPIVIGP